MKKELGNVKIDLGDGYEIDSSSSSSESSFFDDMQNEREYFEAGKEEEEGDNKSGSFDDYEIIDDGFDDDFVEGENAKGEKGERNNETLFEDTNGSDMQTFVLWWKTFDETRALFLGAKFGVDPKNLVFYPDIEKPESNTTIKKAGAIVVKKYSDMIFFSHAPEMILLASILISTGVIFFRAKKQSTEQKEPQKESFTQAKAKQKTDKPNFEFAKTS